jgi:alcohol dehydrogenase (cytochrome c)
VTPIVHDGVMFVHAYGDKVQALDAATGDLLWQYSHRLPKDRAPSVKRSIAIYGTRLYVPTSDTHIVALDAKTGNVIWDQPIADAKMGYGLTGGPLVANGKVMVGTTGRAPGGNFIVALDAATGKRAWQFSTIARPGENGGNTWNGLPIEKRNGASVWVPGSYDRTLNLAFFGPAQTYDTGRCAIAAMRASPTTASTPTRRWRSTSTRDAGLVLQHQPNDQWDLDWAFERHVVQLPVSGKPKTWSSPAASRRSSMRWRPTPASTCSRWISAHESREVDRHEDRATRSSTRRSCLAMARRSSSARTAGGAKSWLPSSYNSRSKMLYVPLVESCMDLTPVAPGGRGSLSTGVRWSLRPRPNSDGLYGRIQAINLETRKSVWTDRQRAPTTTGTLATAGGVVFAGALDRMFAAYDDSTGAKLWQTRLGDVPSNAPITYTVNGRQYVAMVVGNGGAQAATFPVLVPEIRNPPDRGASVWVFALPEKRR